MKYTGGEEPKSKLKPTAKELELANQFAKRFALRKGLIFGEDAHVGNQIPPFVDVLGNRLRGGSNALPPNTIQDIRRIPTYVKELQMDENGIPFYTDETTGNLQYVHPDIARSARFNPNRGKTLADVGAASNIFGNRFASNF